MNIDLDKIMKELPVIAKGAGNVIMEIYESGIDWEVETKSDASPLTLADRQSNEYICSRLKALFPEIPIISEENKAVPYSERSQYEWYWLIDPLDGTKEFIKRNGEFTVNIALIHHGHPFYGVVYAPALEEAYFGGPSLGAFTSRGGQTRSLQPPAFSLQDAGLKAVCSRSHFSEETRSFLESLVEPELVSRGSSLKFLLLATGEAHIYPRLAPTMEWDTAAAQAVLEGVGGKVVVAGTEEPLRYNKENLLNPHFVAYGPTEK